MYLKELFGFFYSTLYEMVHRIACFLSITTSLVDNNL